MVARLQFFKIILVNNELHVNIFKDYNKIYKKLD